MLPTTAPREKELLAFMLPRKEPSRSPPVADHEAAAEVKSRVRLGYARGVAEAVGAPC